MSIASNSSVHDMTLKRFAFAAIGLLLLGIILYALPCTHAYEKSFFFRSGADFLADFLNTVNSQSLSEGFNPYHFSVTSCADRNYPPFSYVLLLPFVPLMPKIGMSLDACHGSVQAMLVGFFGVGLMALSFLVALIVLCRRFTLPLWIAAVLFLSGQPVFCYERGNMILISLSGIVLFLCYCIDERSRLRFLAAFGLALATALKVTPVLFGVLWLNKKDFKWLLLAGGLTLGLSFVPLLFSDHSFSENILKLLANVAERERACAEFSFSIHPSYVLGLFFRQVFCADVAHTFAEFLVRVVKWSSIALGVLAFFLAAFQKMRHWQRFFLLASSQILLLVSSQQYIVLFFIPSLVALLSEAVYDNAEANARWGALEHVFFCSHIAGPLVRFPRHLHQLRDPVISNHGRNDDSRRNPHLLDLSLV